MNQLTENYVSMSVYEMLCLWVVKTPNTKGNKYMVLIFIEGKNIDIINGL